MCIRDSLTSGTELSELTEAMKLDKKNLNNSLKLILLNKIGDSYIYPRCV